jgi:G3E family GTPase
MALIEPIPLTVVAGGAEMASLLPQLLGPAHDVALIATEGIQAGVEGAGIDRAGIDGAGIDGAGIDGAGIDGAGRRITVVPDVGERSPGCPCCRLRLDLVDAVARLVRRRSRPTHLLVAVPDVAADPTAEPDGTSVTAVVHTVLSDPDLRRWVRLDGVVATLDAVASVTRLRTGSPVVEGEGAERLAIADRLLVARADQVVEASLTELRDVMGRLNRIAPVLAPAVERVAVEQLLSIDAWHGAPNVMPATPRGIAADTGHRVAGTPDLVVLEQRGALDPGGVEAWLDEVLAHHAPRLVRLQGALAVDGSPGRVCCHGVGSYAMSHPEHEHSGGRRSDTSLMMLIGHGLPADELAAGLRATAVH